MVSPYAMVLIMASLLYSLCPALNSVGDISPNTFPEPEDHDQERNAQEHFPPWDIRGEIIADHHVEYASDKGTVEALGPADEGRKYHLHIPRGVDKTGRHISVVKYG